MPRYEFSEGASSKFWDIELSGSSFTVRFGRIGTAGQSQTKSFASVELARKEHDKLVAEKVKKGYQLVGDTPAATVASAPPATPASPPASVGSASIRKDFYVYNEATGFLFTSKRLGGKGWDSEGEEWDKAVRKGDIIPIELTQDDPFTVRVVVGGALEPQEAEEWVGRLDWKLRVPDGGFVVCGGSIYVMDEFEEEDDYTKEYVRHLEIPRGDYKASVYMYLGGVNGKSCIEIATGGDEPQPYGEWFRRSRPGETFPAWLHNDCVCDPDEDPGHEKEWKKAKKIENDDEFVEFLIHLTPLGAGEKVAMPDLEGGWFSVPTECRVPERIPLGIPVREIEGHKEEAPDLPPQAIEIFKLTGRFARKPITGGAVEVPLAKLERLYRLPWFCYNWAFPQIAFRPPAGATIPLPANPENVVFSQDGGRTVVGFVATGSTSGCIRHIPVALAALKDVPDGTVVELDASPADEEDLKEARPAGLHRYLGTVRNGVLVLSEAFPIESAEKLNAALAISAQVENGSVIETGDLAVHAAVMKALKKHPFFDDNPAVKKGATGVGVKKPEPVMLNFVALEVFNRSIVKDWPAVGPFNDDTDDDAEGDDAFDKAMDALAKGPPRPKPGGLILKGAKKRVFHTTDASAIDKDAIKKIETVDKEMDALGFKPVGDVVCSAAEYMAVRGYAQTGGSAWGALMVGAGGRGWIEFVQTFGDGASLTTTHNIMLGDEHYRQAYRNKRPDGTPPAMWDAHRRRAAYIAEFHGPSKPLKADTAGLCADIEASFIRQDEKTKLGVSPLYSNSDTKVYTAHGKSIDPDAPALIEEADRLMKELGFVFVDDVAGTFMASQLVRGYAKPGGGDTWAKFVIDASDEKLDSFWEFATRFEKEACLVSTRRALSKDEPKRKIFRILDQKASPAKLLEQHEKRKAELIKKWSEPLAIKPDPKSLAFECAEMVRRLIG